jgi:hypothetical protein
VSDEEIVQLIPAPGWRAIHAHFDDEGDETVVSLERRPLVAWALCRDGDVVPLETSLDGIVADPTEEESFLALEHEVHPLPETKVQSMAARLGERTA